ncbi:MAG: hypothetical protein ACFCUT_02425 [Kiloniellaceae bacterium]
MPNIDFDRWAAIDHAAGDLKALFDTWSKVGGGGADGNLDGYLWAAGYRHVKELYEAINGPEELEGAEEEPEAAQDLAGTTSMREDLSAAVEALGRVAAAVTKDDPPMAEPPLEGFLGALMAYRKAAEWDKREPDSDEAGKALSQTAETVYITPAGDGIDLLHKLSVFQDEEFSRIKDGGTPQHAVQLFALFEDVRRLLPPLGHRYVDTSALENLFYDLDDVRATASALSDSPHLEQHIRGSFNLLAREMSRLYSALYNTTFPDKGAD